MSKYYRAKQDSFMWNKGAVLKLDDDCGSHGGYRAISDLWDACDLKNEYISANIIEDNPDWFERVYEVSILGKAKYLVKSEAQAAHDGLYEEK